MPVFERASPARLATAPRASPLEALQTMVRKARRDRRSPRDDHRKIGWLTALALATAIGLIAYGVLMDRL